MQRLIYSLMVNLTLKAHFGNISRERILELPAVSLSKVLVLKGNLQNVFFTDKLLLIQNCIISLD